jgi:hypothetical protein
MGATVFDRKTSFVELLGICCIFSVFLDKAIRNVFAFDVYFNYPIFLLFLFAMILQTGKLALPGRWFMIGFGIIFTSSIFILLITDRLGFEFWKQVFGILFTALVFYNVLYVFNFNIKKIFEYYLRFAFWVALFGVVNNALHIAGIHLTYSVRAGVLYREASIMGEPFYLALALTPAIGYYSAFVGRTWKERKFQFIVIFTCYLLTYSSIAVTGLVCSVLMSLYLNDYLNVRKNRLILAPVLLLPMVIFINFLINNVNLINARFTDTTELFLSSELKTTEAGKSNASTFALYSNYIIARDSFMQDPLFGSGLGSHPIIYKETFLKYFPSVFLERYGAQNQQDANSKFLRLMSETGLIGIALFMFVFLRWIAPKDRLVTAELHEMGAINYSIFIYILLCLIRNGNYINVGFFLFFFMYYFTWRIVKAGPKQKAVVEPISMG